MRHAIPLDRTNAPNVEIERSLITGRARIFANGAEVAASVAPRQYRIALTDGNEMTLDVSASRWDGAERVRLDGREVVVARELRWYEAAVALLPFLMIFGGAIFAAVGAGALAITLTMVRSNRPTWVRLASCVAVFLVAVTAASGIGSALR
jgi:hypothetical protein